MNNKDKVSKNLEKIKNRLIALGHSKVTIIAVTKNQKAEILKTLLDLKHLHIAENRINETKSKLIELESLYQNENKLVPNFFLHYIAPLQSGNVNQISKIYNYVNGVGSISSLNKLIKNCNESNQIKYFVQIRFTNEESKLGGFTEEEINEIKFFPETKFCEFKGFMTMGPQNNDVDETKKIFNKLRKFRDNNFPKKLLNMGMSNDWEIAIEEGADYIRLGRILFS